MSDMKETSAMGLRPHFIIMDKFTGYPFAHSGISSDLSLMKKRITRNYENSVQSNEDLWEALTMSGQMGSFIGRLHNIAKGYELACDEVSKSVPKPELPYRKLERNLISQLACGMQSNLSRSIKAMEYRMETFPVLCNSKVFMDVHRELIAFRDTSRACIEKVPMATKRYKWEKLQSIEVLEVTHLEVKSL